MSVVWWPRQPVRAIFIEPTNDGQWRGVFEGDEWTAPFVTEHGTKGLVLQALSHPRTSHGLPQVDVVLDRDLWLSRGHAA